MERWQDQQRPSGGKHGVWRSGGWKDWQGVSAQMKWRPVEAQAQPKGGAGQKGCTEDPGGSSWFGKSKTKSGYTASSHEWTIGYTASSHEWTNQEKGKGKGGKGKKGKDAPADPATAQAPKEGKGWDGYGKKGWKSDQAKGKEPSKAKGKDGEGQTGKGQLCPRLDDATRAEWENENVPKAKFWLREHQTGKFADDPHERYKSDKGQFAKLELRMPYIMQAEQREGYGVQNWCMLCKKWIPDDTTHMYSTAHFKRMTDHAFEWEFDWHAPPKPKGEEAPTLPGPTWPATEGSPHGEAAWLGAQAPVVCRSAQAPQVHITKAQVEKIEWLIDQNAEQSKCNADMKDSFRKMRESITEQNQEYVKAFASMTKTLKDLEKRLDHAQPRIMWVIEQYRKDWGPQCAPTEKEFNEWGGLPPSS